MIDGTAASGRATARVQGAIYVTTGLWAVVHRPSFEAITGPKTDYWLVRTIGLLLAAIGGVLWGAAEAKSPASEVRALGMSTAGALLGVDVWYVARGRIRPVYLVDALGEAGMLVGWARSTVG